MIDLALRFLRFIQILVPAYWLWNQDVLRILGVRGIKVLSQRLRCLQFQRMATRT